MDLLVFCEPATQVVLIDGNQRVRFVAECRRDFRGLEQLSRSHSIADHFRESRAKRFQSEQRLFGWTVDITWVDVALRTLQEESDSAGMFLLDSVCGHTDRNHRE